MARRIDRALRPLAGLALRTNGGEERVDGGGAADGRCVDSSPSMGISNFFVAGLGGGDTCGDGHGMGPSPGHSL